MAGISKHCPNRLADDPNSNWLKEDYVSRSNCQKRRLKTIFFSHISSDLGTFLEQFKKMTANKLNLQNPFNVTVYDLKTSKNFESCTVIFFTQDKFNELTDLLKTQYKCNQNPKTTALISSQLVENQNITLTLYTSRKLLIQGAGCWSWRNTVFCELATCLSVASAEDNSIAVTSMSIATRELQPSVLANIPNPKLLFNKVMETFKNKTNSSQFNSTISTSSSLEQDLMMKLSV